MSKKNEVLEKIDSLFCLDHQLLEL